MAYRRTLQIQQRLDEAHARIVRAAVDVVATGGYRSCSVSAVATRARVSPGTVYNHFTNKSALLAEVFRAVVVVEVDAVRAAVEHPGSTDQRIVAVVETFAGRALRVPRLAYALLAEPVDPVVDVLRLEFRTAFRDLIAEVVATGVRDGALPDQNPDVTAAALVGAIAEALVGPLAGRPDPGTVPNLSAFAVRALGVSMTPTSTRRGADVAVLT